jgi:hypothetical protein
MLRTCLLGLAALSLALLTGCGGSEVSANSLDPRLLPAAAVPGFTLARRLDWSNPVDLVGQGIALPDSTYPSAGVKELQDAHVKGAAGEVLTRGAGLNQSEIHVGVAKFDSASDAAKVRSWMHIQDLQQPCLTECVFSPRPTKLPGVPNSVAVVQTTTGPVPGPPGPRGKGKRISGPANYRAEFTVGPYLYWVWFPADASARTKNRFETGVGLYYQHAKQQKS